MCVGDIVSRQVFPVKHSQLLEIIKICQTVSRKILVLELLDNAHGQSNSWALLSEKSVMKLIFGRGGEACMDIHIVLR